MIPKLFIPGTKDFSNEGLGRLAECTSFTVTEERNGIYEAEFGYPIEGRLFSQIREGYIVYATHDDTKDPQPFEIYSHQAPLEGIVTYRARHISYQLNNVICRPYQAADCAAALAGIRSAALTGCDFSFSTDKSVTADFKTTVPQSARSILGGTQSSILDVYGKGDYEFDGFTVKLWVNRGSDKGVSIRYGKNLVSLDQQFDGSNQYNAFVPYWQSSDGAVVYLDHAVMGNTQITTTGPLQVRSFEAIQTHVPADILVRYGSIKTVALDLSGDFEEQPTLAELEARAQALINNSDAYEVRENLSIDFVQLWQTEEYKNVANLQRILLCDTVHIYYEKLGINATAKCIKVVYDTLNERYLSMELGQPTTTLSEQVVSLVGTETKSQIQEAKSTMAEAIKNATELITGGFGGYIKYNYLHDGTPSEMLIMDSPEESTATNIIRLNQNGLGFSTDGGVTYGNAWTIDGKLNADYITTGTLSADRIGAGSIAIGKLDTSTQTTITDAAANAAAAQTAAGNAQTTANGANSREQRIYRSAASGTTSMAANTTWVTASGNTQNAWTARRPVYNSSYPVLFIATQRQTIAQSSGTSCNCTTPVIDQTTTVIDGGHITTGTIDAGVVNVTNINASNITSGTMSANFIKAGTIADDLTTPKNYWNLTTGQFVTTQGTLGGFTIDANGLTASNSTGKTQYTPTGLLFQGEASSSNPVPGLYITAGGMQTGIMNTAGTALLDDSIIQLSSTAYTDPISGEYAVMITTLGDSASTWGIILSKAAGTSYSSIDLTASNVTVNNHSILEIH